MARLQFGNADKLNKLNDEIMDALDLKKGDTLTFKHTGETDTASHRMGCGWYFRSESRCLNHYEGTTIKYWLDNGLATLVRNQAN
jgi:hypothetical protein